MPEIKEQERFYCSESIKQLSPCSVQCAKCYYWEQESKERMRIAEKENQKKEQGRCNKD